MAEDLKILENGSRQDQYELLIAQLEALVAGEEDVVANLANVCAAIMETFKHLWVGFYKVNGKQLVLGPFQGPVACTRIDFGRGVCGQAWQQGETITVPDVAAFPGHIACSSQSKSEIVIPVFKSGEVAYVLDIDSKKRSAFGPQDEHYLKKAAGIVESFI